MTTTTLSPAPEASAARGFTLAEVLIATAISGMILAGVLSTFLFLGRSSANIQNYNDMESQSRRALEVFAEDTRQASAITWTSATKLTLSVNGALITYEYDSATKRFTRTDPSGMRPLVTGILTFEFRAYSITGTLLPLDNNTDLVVATKSTKQLQISLEAARSTQTVTQASNTVLSARFILRNKRVTV